MVSSRSVECFCRGWRPIEICQNSQAYFNVIYLLPNNVTYVCDLLYPILTLQLPLRRVAFQDFVKNAAPFLSAGVPVRKFCDSWSWLCIHVVFLIRIDPHVPSLKCIQWQSLSNALTCTFRLGWTNFWPKLVPFFELPNAYFRINWIIFVILQNSNNHFVGSWTDHPSPGRIHVRHVNTLYSTNIMLISIPKKN